MLHHMLRAAAQRAFNVLDPYFQYVTMLLHGDGTNGSQNNTFLDSSTNNFTITRNGNTTQGTFTPYGSNWSYSGNGSTTYALAPNSTAFDQNAAFTLEWYDFLVSNGAAQAPFYVNTSGYLTVYRQAAGGYQLDKSGTGSLYLSSAYSWSAWHYIAISYDGTNTRFYVDGVLLYTYAGGGVACGTTPELGRGNGGINVNGYISNLRFTKSALYTGSTMTVPTTPLTAITNCTFLAFQSNRWIDNSTNNLTITPYNSPSVQRFSPFSPTTAYSTSVIGGSGYFDNSGDYLTAPASTSLLLNGTNSTIEGWWYLNAAPGGVGSSTPFFAQTDLANASTSGTSNYWAFSDASTVYFSGSSDTTNVTFSASLIPVRQWFHLAWVITSGTSATIYLNGVSVASGSINAVGSNAAYITVLGAARTGGGTYSYLNGFASNFRIVKGSQVYTAAFTPPTAPLTAITNTSLLLNFTNAGILDNAMMNDLETVGDAQISTSVKKYGTGSMKFDGTGDYAITYNSNLYTFGTGEFTVEAWVYPTSFPAEAAIISTATSTDYQGFTINVGTSGNLIIALGAGGSWTVVTTSGGTLSANTWQHIALTRSGNVFRMFVSGTQSYTTTNSVSLTNTNNAISVGGRTAGGGQYFNGYIDDLRITKGVARYTANFTAPTAAFPNN